MKYEIEYKAKWHAIWDIMYEGYNNYDINDENCGVVVKYSKPVHDPSHASVIFSLKLPNDSQDGFDSYEIGCLGSCIDFSRTSGVHAQMRRIGDGDSEWVTVTDIFDLVYVNTSRSEKKFPMEWQYLVLGLIEKFVRDNAIREYRNRLSQKEMALFGPIKKNH